MEITPPLTNEDLKNLRAGKKVFITGTIFTARDAAHEKLVDLINQGQELPIPLEGQIIYYVGPAPARPGQSIGPAGPTTSYRMDSFTVPLLKKGLKGMIGKGHRSDEVVEALKKYKGVYLAAVGGAAALIAESIKQSEVVAYPELGPEAIRKLEVERLPTIVVNDIYGSCIYCER
ncbi:MAG: Fe-S-containing hydro-lyase [Bacillota bacterium]